MKPAKHITVAAFIAAGTAFAFAEDVSFTITRSGDTITFNEDSASVALSYVGKSYSTTGSSSEGWSSPSSHANTFSPSVQLVKDSDAYWTMTFTITNESDVSISLNSIAFNCYVINGDGSDKQANIPVKTWLYSGSLDSTALGSLSPTISATGTTAVSFGDLDLTLAANSSVELIFKFGSVSDYNTYAGISGGSLSFSAIPEPSAFGLLAGLGALALAGTRRRRK